MKHLGDISKINGAEIEPVDLITFGSPCQDLSVAGKRAGLKHEANGDENTTRSGLFMEAVRIIKEMREATDGKYPRFALWENVPGAFSSNKGEDFRIVLEELIKIIEPEAVMPEVPKAGWAYADCYSGHGWSIAYRVFDAQYWGVPQRRRRIYLVADFGGECAEKVLFEREGLRGHLTESPPPRERVTAYVEGGAGATDCEGFDGYNSTLTGEQSATLGVNCGTSTGRNGVVVSVRNQNEPDCVVYESHPQDSRVNECRGVSPTVAAKYAKGAADTPLVCVATQQGGAEISENGICPTVTAAAGMSGNNQPWVVYNGENITNPLNRTNPQPGDPCHTLGTDSRNYLVYALDQQGGKGGANYAEEVMPTLCSDSHGTPHAVAYGISSYDSNAMKSDNPHSGIYKAETSRTIDLNGGNPACNQGGIAVVQSIGIIDSIGGQAERGWEGDVAPTLKASHYKFPPVITKAAGFCTEHSAKAGGVGFQEETAQLASGAEVSGCLMASGYEKLGAQEMFSGDYTVIETRPAEAITVHGEEISGTLLSRDYKGVGRWDSLDKVVCQEEIAGVDCRNMNEYPELYPTLQAKPNGGQSLNFSGAVRDRYIVRRLTPIECARLQGFHDSWGNIDQKDDMTEEEFRFWHEVRNTHAAINGKTVKDYTKKQVLSWYNKLHSDSAEYKMWGNGIALPTALYCMQGVADALNRKA